MLEKLSIEQQRDATGTFQSTERCLINDSSAFDLKAVEDCTVFDLDVMNLTRICVQPPTTISSTSLTFPKPPLNPRIVEEANTNKANAILETMQSEIICIAIEIHRQCQSSG